MMNDKEIIEAVRRLAKEHPDPLGDDAEQIAQWLNQTPEDDPEALRQTANRLLKLLQEHPEAWETVCKEIGLNDETKGATRTGLDMLPGDACSVPAGTRMKCPKSGCDYRRSMRQKGQRLFCPNHDGELLVPVTQLS